FQEKYNQNDIPFVIAEKPWDVDMYGNHRAVVEVSGINDSLVVSAVLPWRRADLRLETKKIIVVDANSGALIDNVIVKELTAEKGVIWFQPTSGAGIYYIYYLPYKFRKGYAAARYEEPWNNYLPPNYNPDN